jgi:hypothetical protein
VVCWFVPAETELDACQDISQDPDVIAIATSSVPNAAAGGRSSNRGGCPSSSKLQEGIVDLAASDDDEPALVENIDWQQAAREVGADTAAATGSNGPELGAAGSAGEGSKVQLVFKTKAGQSVKIKVLPSDPLQHAFDRFLEHAKSQGWVAATAEGRVRFVLDGDNLAGRETAEDLDLEDDMMIEVHI